MEKTQDKVMEAYHFIMVEKVDVDGTMEAARKTLVDLVVVVVLLGKMV